MTLVVCLKGKDGMVLASDSRGTFGDPRATTAQNDTLKKVYSVSKYVGVLLAGSGELGSTIMNEIGQKMKETDIKGATQVMQEIRNLLLARFDDWFKGWLVQPIQGSPIPARPTLVLFVAGYDLDSQGRPTTQRIYSLNCHMNFAPFLHDYGFGLEGVPQYALYLLNRLYTTDSEIDTLLPLASYVITETASQDGKVGGPVQLMKILPDIGCVTLNSEEINGIIQSNINRSKNLKVSFFGE